MPFGAWLWVGVAVMALGFLYLPTLGVGLGQILAFLLVLLCPLPHFLGGHRHGSHEQGDSAGPRPSATSEQHAKTSDGKPGGPSA